MKVFYTDHFVLPLPPKHRFPMSKYALLRQRVRAAGLVPPENLCVPPAATDAQITRVHTPEYLRRMERGELTVREIRRLGFPWSPELVERSRRSVGGTIAACRAALSDGLAINLAGGTHHAFPDHGKGYCVFNDAAIAARTIQAEGLARRVVILDCDVHQGDGTAVVFADDPTVFTFSIHGAKNYPFHKQKSDLDVELPDGTGDAVYLAALETGLRRALAAARADLAIYLAGADPYFGDRLGRLSLSSLGKSLESLPAPVSGAALVWNPPRGRGSEHFPRDLSLSKEGLAERDQLVLSRCRAAGLPVAVTMAGGYAEPVEETVGIHFQTVRVAAGMG